ncbi:hypothetical protein Tco_0853913 [Tanacetum coccineum]
MMSYILSFAYYRVSVIQWLEVLLLAMMRLLRLCIYEFAIMIGYWIVKVVTSSDLGGVAGHRVCSHAVFDAAISAPAVACSWIVKVVFDLNLGVVARQCVCSHGRFHMPLSESLLS